MARRIRRISLWIGATLLAIVLVLGIALVAITRAPLPALTGQISLSGLKGEVTVKRDAQGIPHIYASSDQDLFYAQGFLTAQERFFQMDLQRRMPSGQLAELVGESAVEMDIQNRTLGVRAVAEKEWDLLSDEARSFYESYAAGVNSYLEGKAPWQVANEYAVLSTSVPVGEIRPWDGVDSLVWWKQLAAGLGGGYLVEAYRMKQLSLLGSVEAVETLYPTDDQSARLPNITEQAGSNLSPRSDYPEAPPIPLTETSPSLPQSGAASDREGTGASATSPAAFSIPSNVPSSSPASPNDPKASSSPAPLADSLLSLSSSGYIPGLGSNSFAIAGKYTASGKPILANDPHLMLNQPSIWNQVGLHCQELNDACTFDVSGFAMAGIPGVIIGRNSHLSWGFTSTGAVTDIADAVIEKNIGTDSYEYDGKTLPYHTRKETITIAGGKTREIDIRESIHGPILPDSLAPKEDFAKFPGAPKDFSVAMQWSVLTPSRTAQAHFNFNRARNSEELVTAASDFTTPSMNLLYATDSGDIGYKTTGLFPIRPIKAPSDGHDDQVPAADNFGADGRWPRPGWDSSYDWKGYYAHEDLPATLNPPSGLITPANQTITFTDVGPYLGANIGFAGYRSQQMRDELQRLAAAGKVTPEQAGQVMMLDVSPHSQEVGDTLTSISLSDPRALEMQNLLRQWREKGSHFAVDEAGAAIMAALHSHLSNEIAGDELGQFALATPQIKNLLAQPDHPLWDDTRTPEKESVDDILRQAFTSADKDLTAQMGENIQQWRWGSIHKETPEHQIFGTEGVPSFIRDYFNGTAREVGGGDDIPNANAWMPFVSENGTVKYEVISGGSMRMVVDMSNSNTALWISPTGNSGHPLSPHYEDQNETWAKGEFYVWPHSPSAVEEHATGTLTLSPAAP
ncbi:MAG: penicillin acylase family protein [Actinomycetaceae bacterium]|nr:penicillin acylase family protein [Actinomycetaceae bacterium]